MSVKVREKPKGSGVWWVFINHRGKRKSKRIGKDKKLAQDIAKKIEARLLLGDVGVFDDTHSPTFADYAKQWIDVHVPVKCKPKTERDYRSILKRYIMQKFGERPIKDIKRLHVKNFLMGELNSGTSQHIVHKIKVIMSSVFNLAMDDDKLSANPAHRIGSLADKNDLKNTLSHISVNPLTRKELALLLDTFRESFPKHYPFALTLARTGMRLGEAVALKWSDIDFNGRFINVQRSYSSSEYLTTPKSGKPRRVDMSMQLTETLWILKHDLVNKSDEDMPEWVFPNQAGRLLDANHWRRRVFRKALDKAELRQIRIHDLRHTYASLLLQAGESMAYIRDQLGHHSIKVTVDIYGHLVPGGNKEAVDRLDDTPQTAPFRTLYAPTIK